MTKTFAYVQNNTERGLCTCGRCCDYANKPEDKQPTGHTADLIFFKVAKKKGSTMVLPRLFAIECLLKGDKTNDTERN